MSTEFSSTATDELAFVRFAGSADGVRCTCFEFGTFSQFERVTAAMRAGETFVPLTDDLADDPTSADDLDALVVAGRVTFGRFPFTVEVGSGELFRFTVEE